MNYRPSTITKFGNSQSKVKSGTLSPVVLKAVTAPPAIGKLRYAAVMLPVAVLLLFTARVQADSLFLVEDGMTRAVVVTADNADATTLAAAGEIVSHVARATGVNLELLAEAEVHDYDNKKITRIYVGDTKAARKQGISAEHMVPEAFLLRVRERDVFVTGRDDGYDRSQSGTLFGVYELLERMLQVRWLWPGELGTYVPQANTVKIPADLDLVIEPAFGKRHITQAAQYATYRSSEERAAYREDQNAYLLRHRARGRSTQDIPPCACHTLQTWADRYGEEHPEWFALNEDGERDPMLGLCVSNPDLHRYIVEEYEEHSGKAPARGYRVWPDAGKWLRLGETDRDHRPCLCEDCRAWDGPMPEDTSFGEGLYDYYGRLHISDRYAKFYQTVYELAREVNPEVRVSGLLYRLYALAPTSDIKIDSAVYGYYVPWGFGARHVWFPFCDELFEWKKEQWLGWQETGISMLWRPNHWFDSYMPHVTWQPAEFFRFAHQNGMVGYRLTRLSGQWATRSPVIYLDMRLCAKPELEIEEILNEYYEAFGPAAEQVRRYFDYWEEYSHRREHGPLYRVANANLAYPEKLFPPAAEILEEALSAARESSREEYAQRVEFLQIGLEHARLISRFWGKLDHVSSGQADLPEDPSRRREARQAFAELEDFRHQHGNSYAANFGEALRRERRSTDIEKIREDD